MLIAGKTRMTHYAGPHDAHRNRSSAGNYPRCRRSRHVVQWTDCREPIATAVATGHLSTALSKVARSFGRPELLRARATPWLHRLRSEKHANPRSHANVKKPDDSAGRASVAFTGQSVAFVRDVVYSQNYAGSRFRNLSLCELSHRLTLAENRADVCQGQTRACPTRKPQPPRPSIR